MMGVVERIRAIGRRGDDGSRRLPAAAGGAIEPVDEPLEALEDDGEKPLRTGSYSLQAVMPSLTIRQLRRLDDLGPVGFGRDRGRGADRRIRRAVERAWRRADRDRNRAERELRNMRRTVRDPDRDKFTARRLDPRLMSGLASGWGSDRLGLPWHSTSISSSAVLDPVLAPSGPMLDGPVIGLDWRSGVPYRYDPWSAYRKGLVTHVNGMVCGVMGSGKSMALKTLAWRSVWYGRQVLVEGDPKGEWAQVAHAIGGQVVRAGGGDYINPLDLGDRPVGVDAGQWDRDVLVKRVDALKAMVAPLLHREVSQAESRVLGAAVAELSDGRAVPTIAALCDLLSSDWVEDADIRGIAGQGRDTCDTLLLALDDFVHGSYAGAFEKESTVDIDPAAPMIVFDTGSVYDGDEIRRNVYMAAMDAAIERLCRRRDGLFRVIIAEEGWHVLSNLALVRSWNERMRLSGDMGTSSWMVLHELADLDRYADKGSGEAALIESVLTMTSTKILHRQSPSSMPSVRRLLPDLTDEEESWLRTLPQGVGLWRVGERMRDAVLPLMGPTAYGIFNTDKGRNG